MSTHHVDQAKYDRAVALGVGAILMLRPTCGAKATAVGALDMTSNWEYITCKRCLLRHL